MNAAVARWSKIGLWVVGGGAYLVFVLALAGVIR